MTDSPSPATTVDDLMELVEEFGRYRWETGVAEEGNLPKNAANADERAVAVRERIRAAAAVLAARPPTPEGCFDAAVALLRECLGPLEVSAALFEDEDAGANMESLVASVKKFTSDAALVAAAPPGAAAPAVPPMPDEQDCPLCGNSQWLGPWRQCICALAHPPVSPTEDASRPLEQERALPAVVAWVSHTHAGKPKLLTLDPDVAARWMQRGGDVRSLVYADAKALALETLAACALPEEATRLDTRLIVKGYNSGSCMGGRISLFYNTGDEAQAAFEPITNAIDAAIAAGSSQGGEQ